MRKAVGVLAALGLLLAALVLALPAGLPELSNAEKTLAVTEDQTVYLAENRNGSSWLYGVRDDGSVQRTYPQDAAYRITLLSAYENDVYFVQIPHLSETGWRLLRLGEDGTTEILYEGTSDLPDSPEAVSVSSGGIDLTFLQDGKISVYRMELSGGEPVQLLETSFAQGETAVSAVFAEDRLFCLLSDGRVRSSRAGEQGSETLGETGGFTLLSASQGSVWAYRRENGSACSGAVSLQNGSGVEVNGQAVLCGGRGGAKGQTVVLSVESGSTVLLRIAETDVRRQTPQTSFLARLQFKTPLLLFFLLTYAVCAVLILITVFLCTRMHRLAVRVTSCCICLLLFAAGISGTISWTDTSERSGILLETQAASAGQIRADILEELDLSSILAGTSGETEVRRLIISLSMETQEQYASFNASVLGADGDTVQISDQAVDGTPVAAVYGERIRAMAEDAAAQGTAVQQSLQYGGRLCAYDVRPLYRYGEEVGMLVSQVILVRSDQGRMLLHSFLPPLLGALIASVAIAFLTFTMLRPLRRLTSRMRLISEGDFNLVPLRTASDEVGDMWQSLREMAVALRIKDYETNATVRSFYRFVPRGIDRLLNRASIMETSLGDMANVTGTVGILSIQNREELRTSLDDSGFLGFLNDSYSLIDHQMEQHDGMLLSSGFDPEGMEILFQKSPDQGVAFSLGLLGEGNGMASEQASDFFLLLHSTSFLYGLVGTEQRTFSLLSSSEIAFLHSFAKHFKGTGVRVAATNACLKAMTRPCASRYLGFVSSEDGKYRYKLHQILEGCSDMEKSLYLSYDEKFQKGISLFCQNDFYLARNLFSAILKLNPNDGIARWYLFACEHYFNQNDPGSEGYNLFGIQG